MIFHSPHFCTYFFAVAKPSYSVQWLMQYQPYSLLCFTKWLCMSPWKPKLSLHLLPSYCLYTCECSTSCSHESCSLQNRATHAKVVCSTIISQWRETF